MGFVDASVAAYTSRTIEEFEKNRVSSVEKNLFPRFELSYILCYVCFFCTLSPLGFLFAYAMTPHVHLFHFHSLYPNVILLLPRAFFPFLFIRIQLPPSFFIDKFIVRFFQVDIF